MRRLDHASAITFLDVAAEETAPSCPLDPAALLARFHAEEDGELHSGAAAFAAMWRAIPLLRPLGMLARSPVALGWLEQAYTRFLRVRPHLQRLAARWEAA